MEKGGGSPFTQTSFYSRIAQVYKEGAGLVVAANLEQLIAKNKVELTKGKDAAQREGALKQLGILNLKYFALDQKDNQGKTQTRAVLSFNESRGISFVARRARTDGFTRIHFAGRKCSCRFCGEESSVLSGRLAGCDGNGFA